MIKGGNCGTKPQFGGGHCDGGGGVFRAEPSCENMVFTERFNSYLACSMGIGGKKGGRGDIRRENDLSLRAR